MAQSGTGQSWTRYVRTSVPQLAKLIKGFLCVSSDLSRSRRHNTSPKIKEIPSTIMILINKYPCYTTELNIVAYNETKITILKKKAYKHIKQL